MGFYRVYIVSHRERGEITALHARCHVEELYSALASSLSVYQPAALPHSLSARTAVIQTRGFVLICDIFFYIYMFLIYILQ